LAKYAINGLVGKKDVETESELKDYENIIIEAQQIEDDENITEAQRKEKESKKEKVNILFDELKEKMNDRVQWAKEIKKDINGSWVLTGIWNSSLTSYVGASFLVLLFGGLIDFCIQIFCGSLNFFNNFIGYSNLGFIKAGENIQDISYRTEAVVNDKDPDAASILNELKIEELAKNKKNDIAVGMISACRNIVEIWKQTNNPMLLLLGLEGLPVYGLAAISSFCIYTVVIEKDIKEGIFNVDDLIGRVPYMQPGSLAASEPFVNI
jgi:hypothetical protein